MHELTVTLCLVAVLVATFTVIYYVDGRARKNMTPEQLLARDKADEEEYDNTGGI